jgi:hypothetical protein
MRDGTFDVQRLLVQLLERLVVLLLGEHLDLKGVNLEQLRPLLQIFFAVVILQSSPFRTSFSVHQHLPDTTGAVVLESSAASDTLCDRNRVCQVSCSS